MNFSNNAAASGGAIFDWLGSTTTGASNYYYLQQQAMQPFTVQTFTAPTAPEPPSDVDEVAWLKRRIKEVSWHERSRPA